MWPVSRSPEIRTCSVCDLHDCVVTSPEAPKVGVVFPGLNITGPHQRQSR
jgi:hypothetical protein